MDCSARAALIGACLLICCTSVTAADFGRTAGSFNVNPSGAATYSIPIWTPPGPNGLTPNISLDYSSQAENGLAGVGWNLSAAREISRCERTRHQDGNAGGIELSANDRFCIGGNRLRLISGTYGAAGSIYYTEIADYSRITAYGTAGNGPAYFIVEARSGLKYEYGATSSSRVLLGATALRWMLNKVYDRNNNNYLIAYNNGTGFAVPDVISWTPTSLGAATYRYEAKFNYVNNRVDKDSYIGKVAGHDVVNRYRLENIQIKSSGAVVRKYRFTYNTSTVTTRSRLEAAKECADDGETNCLLPITFNYQTGQAGVTGGAGLTPAGSSNGLVPGRYDLNGDGRDDILYINAGTCYATFGASAGFSSPVSVGTTTCGIVDKFLPKGRDAILLPGTPARVAYWNDATSSFTTTNMGFNLSLSPAPTSADYDGDGLADIVQISSSWQAIVTRRNTSTGSGAPSFSLSTLSSADLGGQPNIGWGGVFPRFPNGLQRADFNGDGTQDLNGYYVINTGWSVINYYVRLHGSNSGYTSVQPFDLGSTAISFPSLNFNDDACTDILIGSNIQVAPCNNAGGGTVAVPATPLLMLDWDGDRKTDILVNSGGNFAVYLSTGAGFFGPIATSVPSSGTGHFGVDVDGDRMDDLIRPNGTSAFSYWTHTASGLAPANATNVPDLLSSVTDGFGVNSTPSYVSTAWGNYSTGDVPAYPLQYTISRLVVAQVNASDGIGGTYNKTYHYHGARFHAERGDAGFQRVDATDGRNGLIARTYFEQSFPRLGMVVQTELMQPNGTTPIYRTVFANDFETLSSAAYNQRYFLVIDQATQTEYEVGGTLNGNLLRTVITANLFEATGGTLYDQIVTTTEPVSGANGVAAGGTWVARTYLPTANIVNDTSNWCLGRPGQIQQINYDNQTYGGVITRTTSTTWNATYCRPTQMVSEPGSGTLQVTTDIGYDGFGNVNSTTVTGVGMTARTTSVSYSDSTYTTGQFPLSVTNALSQTSTSAWNYDLGVPSNATDPNGISISWLYDPFGRRNRENRADGTATTWSYESCEVYYGAGNCPFYRLTSIQKEWDSGSAMFTQTWRYFDRFDRLVAQYDKTQQEPSHLYIARGFTYDSLGRISQSLIPCITNGCPANYVTNSYDLLNRVVQSSRPISESNLALQSTNIYYEGLTTRVRDAQLKDTYRVVNGAGQLVRIIDHDNYRVAFGYDAFGGIKQVWDGPGNILQSSNYNLRGMLTSRTDLDMGSWGFTPNALGETVSQTDAKGQTTSFDFDLLGRLKSRTEAEGTSYFNFGTSAAAKNIGRLASMTGPGYSESYAYDSIGRPSTTTISADTTYQIDYSYNSIGTLDSLTYPTSTAGYRLKLKYEYQYGQLRRISDFNIPADGFWVANTTDAFGRPTQELHGNGLITNRAYDKVHGWLKSIQTGVGGGTSVQHLAYEWDLVGNLKKRIDGNQANLTEEFFYDNLNRLRYSNLNGNKNSDTYYNELGNITYKWDSRTYMGDYTYHPTRKHQITSTSSGYNAGYDANGNVTSRTIVSIDWTSGNYPKCFRTGSACSGSGSVWSEFSYTPDRRYWKQASNYTVGGESTTYYIGGLLEKVVNSSGTDYRHMIRAGGSAIIVSRKSSGTNTVNYVMTDHQGSSSAITDASGGVLANLSYEAFGWRRGANWAGNPNTGEWATIAATTRRGFTDHSMLDNFGFIHMNGRVYDPELGRFLSADPYIPDPMSTQSYNRYSYVENNPLKYTDPSGFTPQWVCYAYFDIRSFIVPGGARTRSSDGNPGVIVPGVGFGIFPALGCSFIDLPDPSESPTEVPNEPQTPDSTRPVVGWLAVSTTSQTIMRNAFADGLFGRAIANVCRTQKTACLAAATIVAYAATRDTTQQAVGEEESKNASLPAAGVSTSTPMNPPPDDDDGSSASRQQVPTERQAVIDSVTTPDKGLYTSQTVADQLATSRAYIPNEAIKDTIRWGTRTVDPQGVAGHYMYRAAASRNGSSGTLEVLVDEANGVINHVLFRSGL